MTTGATLELGITISNKKKYSNFNVYSCPIWGQKFKKKILTELKKWNEIIVLEDHLIDCGFFSFLNEIKSSFGLKLNIKSLSLNNSIIGKSGSQKFLNNLGGLK